MSAIDKPIKKHYWDITEVAKMLEVSTSRLRFYESEGIGKPDRRGANGLRKYTEDTVGRLRTVIRCAQSGYFTINGLRYIYHHCELPNINDIQ